MARGNQRDKAREANQKKMASMVRNSRAKQIPGPMARWPDGREETTSFE